MITRINEYFGEPKVLGLQGVVSCIPPKLFKQERDWTCSLACLRSIGSVFGNVSDEDDMIREYALKPGPYYSKDIVALGLLEDFHYSVGSEQPDVCQELVRLFDALKRKRPVMVEMCRSYDHWMVLLAYFTNNSEYTEDHVVLLWDPYYNEVVTLRASEFCDTWISGDHAKNGVVCDCIILEDVK